jgi:hypothetical protein
MHVRKNKPLEMQKEYRFDYRKSKPNRFAEGLIVVIEPENAKVFRTARAVNSALKAVKELIPKVARAKQ